LIRHGVIVARSHQSEKFVGRYGSPSLLAGMATRAKRLSLRWKARVYSMYSHSQMSAGRW
jgi:hypothetical protein